MRRSTPCTPIHFLAVAASDATMSSHPPFRGRGRGFSGRYYSGGRGQFVSGDAHFRTVRDANSGFRREEGGSFVNQPRYQNTHFNPRPTAFYHQNPQFHDRPPYNQTQQFWQPPSFDQNQAFGFQFRHPPTCNQTQQFRQTSPFDQRQTFRPPQHLRSGPPDYRDWEYATTPPPRDSVRFKILSYNILADYLAFDHRNKLYYHIPPHILDWQRRKRSITYELGWWSADIMCLQEVDRFHDLEQDFKLKGYSGIWKMRTGNAVDGCAIFWRTSRFKLIYEECIEFNKLGLRENVAQICVLELINQNGSLPPSMRGSSKVVICNIHVLYNPKRGEIKLGQVRVLLDRAKAVSKTWDDVPVVICGDFNCTPKSPLYNFISEQKLDLSKIDRDKVSGQASGVIHGSRLYIPNPSERSTNGSVQATSTVVDNKVNIKPSNSVSDIQSPDNHDNSVENTQTVLNMSCESCKQMKCGEESSTLSDPETDTQLAAADDSNIFEVNLGEESNDASHSQSGAPVNYINDEVHAVTFMSCVSGVVHTDTTGIGWTEQISDAVSPSCKEFLTEKSNVYVPGEDESMKLDSSITSLGDNQSSRIKMDPKSVDTFVAEISSTKPARQVSDCEATEVARIVDRENPSLDIENDLMNCLSSSYQVDESRRSTNIDFPLQEKLEKLSVHEIDEPVPVISSESIGEDAEAFISELHDAEEYLSHELGPSNKTDAEKTIYNPSLWTPMEIETATGNAEHTFLEHPLPLKSTYTDVMDNSGTRDSSGEPLVTSYNRCFWGTVDYIWRSEGLQTVRALAPVPILAMKQTAGFPTKKWGSDHIALVSELAFSNDATKLSRNIQ